MQTHCSLLASVLLASPAAAGVYAHYPFDNDYSDASGNGRNGTLTDVGTAGNSGITSTPGDFKFGNGAMNFSTDRDYVAIPSKTFGSGSPYTIAFWAKKAEGDTGSAADWDMAIGQRDNTSFFIGLGGNSNPGLRWRSTSNATERQADFNVTKDFAWHHYAVVASGTTITLYVDGQLFGTATGKQTGFTVDTIGEAYTAAAGYDFNGLIDEVWIYDEPLTATAVDALYQTNDANSFPAYAGFHHRYDGDLNDSSAAGNNGTAVGGASVTADPGGIASGSGALFLDGEDGSFVTLPAAGSFSASHPWTIAWWARREGIGSNKGMVLGRGDNSSDFIWLNDSNSGLRFRSSNNVTLDFTAAKDSDLHHYALVADGTGNLSLYVDGLPSQTLTGNTSFTIDTIGKAYPASGHYNFHGFLDEIHVVPSALSAAQVGDLFEDEKPESWNSDVSRVRVILLGGQSNADGRADASGLPPAFQSPQTDVDFYYRTEGNVGALTTLRPGLSETSQFGPEVLLGSRLADIYADEPGTRVAIIKYANGGTNLHTQWKAGGDATTAGDGAEYVTFQQTVTSGRAALAGRYPGATIELDSMVWMQGEADASASAAGNYGANLTAFISDVRATYGESLSFIIARLSSGQTAIDATWLSTVRAAQDAVAAADPRTGIISTDGFSMKGDNLHFDAAGQQAMGESFAGEAAYYMWMNETFTSGEIDAGLAEPGADYDGDGQTNLSEFLGASDPKSGGSTFSASVSFTSPTSGTISYESIPSRLYAVERYDKGTGVWTMVLPFAKGEAGLTSRPLDLSAPAGIFRVHSKLP